jgi:hypothetical protein
MLSRQPTMLGRSSNSQAFPATPPNLTSNAHKPHITCAAISPPSARDSSRVFATVVPPSFHKISRSLRKRCQLSAQASTSPCASIYRFLRNRQASLAQPQSQPSNGLFYFVRMFQEFCTYDSTKSSLCFGQIVRTFYPNLPYVLPKTYVRFHQAHPIDL